MSPLLPLLAAALLAGCAAERPGPVATERYADGNGGTLLVLLPGRGDGASSFRKSGFVELLRKKEPGAAIVGAELTRSHYAAGSAPERLREDVILPGRRDGYLDIWLIGVSMGATGALLYELEFPGELAGIVLLAPYLGDEKLVEALAAGREDPRDGPESWKRDLLSPSRMADLWKRLADLPESERKKVFLCWGSDDPFASAARLLAPLLPAENAAVLPGGHEWRTWKRLMDELMTRNPLGENRRGELP
jgi:hypothetical protein